MLKAFHVSDEELWAAEDAEQAAREYEAATGERCGNEYPREMTEAELDAGQPEFDEDGERTGGKTSVRAMLAEQTSVGFLAGPDW